MLRYFHIISYQRTPFACYGIAVYQNGMIESVPYDRPELSWMKKYHIDALIKFFEDKTVIITEVKTSQTNEDGVGNREAGI